MKFYFVTVPPENLRTWFTRRTDADHFAKHFDGANVSKLTMPQRNDEGKPRGRSAATDESARAPC